jgi:hypothetical protein
VTGHLAQNGTPSYIADEARTVLATWAAKTDTIRY